MQLKNIGMAKKWENERKLGVLSITCRILKYDINNDGIADLVYAIDEIGVDAIIILNDIIDDFDTCSAEGIETKLIMNKLHAKLVVSEKLEKLFARVGVGEYKGGINFIDTAVADPFKLSYIPDDRLNRFESDDIWDEDERQAKAFMGRPGKVFKRLFPDSTPSEVSNFVDEFTAEFRDDYDMLLTAEVRKFYLEAAYYDDEKGSLGSSCMKHSNLNHYMKFYEDEGVELLVLLRGGKVCGRALVWSDVKFLETNNTTLMDRVYLNDDKDLPIFKKHAKQQGWVMKKHQNYDDKIEFVEDGESFEDMEVRYTLKNDLFEYKSYPYCDTFGYATRDTLHNTVDDAEYSLMETNGSLGDDDRVYCADTEEYVSEDSVVFSGYSESYHLPENCVEVYGGGYVVRDNTVFSECHNDYIIAANAIDINDDSDCIDRDHNIINDPNLCTVDNKVYTTAYAKAKGYEYSELYEEWLSDPVWSEFHDSYIIEKYAADCDVIKGKVDMLYCLDITLDNKKTYIPIEYLKSSDIEKIGDEYFTPSFLKANPTINTTEGVTL